MTSPIDFSVVTEDPNISYAKTTEPITYPGDVTYKGKYQIDLSNIFLAANSAGSITILNAAY